MSPFLHPCGEPGCDRPGIVGENVHLRKGETGDWRCAEHDDNRKRRRREATTQARHGPEARAGRGELL